MNINIADALAEIRGGYGMVFMTLLCIACQISRALPLVGHLQVTNQW
jgi:hypothetical protein